METNKNGRTGEEREPAASRSTDENTTDEQRLGRGQNLGETGTEHHEPGYVHTGNAHESADEKEVDGTP